MTNKKDEGNSFFKQQKYAESIQCYQQYVKSQHKDNSKAYSNMALGCFKLKRFKDCIKACEMAVQLEPQFQKPYFRMFQAYRQLKDNYGMILFGSKFCKFSKDQTEIQIIQKELLKARQDLSYKDSKSQFSTQNDKLILQIINSDEQDKQPESVWKQPQRSTESRWHRIEQTIKSNKQLGLNLGRKFISQQGMDQALKEKYIATLRRLKNYKPNQQPKQSHQQQVVDSEEEPQVQQIQRYMQRKLIQSVNLKKNDQQNQIKSAVQNVEDNEQAKMPLILEQNNDLDSRNKNSKLQPKPQNNQNWHQYVSKQKAQYLFISHIKIKMEKASDQFDCFYKCLCQILHSTQLDKFQKQAILRTAPQKVKKFTLLMKSYTGRQRQQLTQLFSQNQLQNVMETLYSKK